MRGPAFFAYANNYLIDVKFGVIVDVEASRAIRQAEVGAAKTMIERTQQRFGIMPERLAADSAYGSATTLNWIVNEKNIVPHIPVIDKSEREDGTLSRSHFTFDKDRNVYVCPEGKLLRTTGRIQDGEIIFYRASTMDCGPLWPLSAKSEMLPKVTTAQDSTQHLRGGSRRRTLACRDRSLRMLPARSKACRDAVRSS